MKIAWMMLVLALVFGTTKTEAQEWVRGPWGLSAHLSASAVLGESDWTVRHPYVGGSSVTWETLRGAITHGVLLKGGLELRRKHLGVRGTIGILPQEFSQEFPAQVKEYSLLLGGISAVFYPSAGSQGRMEPYLLMGAGAQKATGEMGDRGFYLSAAGGLQTRLTTRVVLDGGVEYHRLKYTQVDLGGDIEKDLTATPVSLFLGMCVGW